MSLVPEMLSAGGLEGRSGEMLLHRSLRYSITGAFQREVKSLEVGRVRGREGSEGEKGLSLWAGVSWERCGEGKGEVPSSPAYPYVCIYVMAKIVPQHHAYRSQARRSI